MTRATRAGERHFGLAFVATGEATEGQYFLAETAVPPGDAGPPPHTHAAESEGFYVRSGALTLVVGGEEFPLTRGDYLDVEPGEEHTWRNDSSAVARAAVIFVPAGIEEMFVELEEEPGDLVEIGRKYGTEFRADG